MNHRGPKTLEMLHGHTVGENRTRCGKLLAQILAQNHRSPGAEQSQIISESERLHSHIKCQSRILTVKMLWGWRRRWHFRRFQPTRWSAPCPNQMI